MGRQARKIRDSNIYHVMLRGVDRQVSFEDQQDEDKFLSLLNRYRLRCGFAVYGLRTVLQAVIVNILAQPLRLLAQPCVSYGCGFCTFHTAAGAADYLHKRGHPGSLH